MTKHLYALAVILMLTSCEARERIVYVQVKHDIPSKPYLPKLSDDELSCLADQTYERLALRDQAWRLYVEKLETLLH